MATEQLDLDAQKKLARDLWQAVDNNDVTKVRSLLGQGADPNHQLYWSDEWADDPPLHRACWEGYLEIVKTLVTHGARTDKGDGRYNRTPLHWACMGVYKEVVQYLIEEVGCSTDVRDHFNSTPLHYACRGGSKYLVQYLVEELKMNVDVRNRWGQTPLHYACVEGHIQLVKYLVEELKWDVDVTANAGRTPLDMAVRWGKTEVADYLKPLVSTPEPDTPNGSKQLPSTSSRDDSNLTSSIDIQNQTYLKKLDELMTDKSGTIELHYLKTYFIGPSGIGKTTTRQRLVGSITNLSLLPEDQRKRCSTLLAECEQVLAFVDKSGTKLEFKASSSLEEETQFIFSYLMSCESIEETPKKQPTKETTDPKNQTTVPKETVSPTPGLIPELPEKVVKVTTVDVGKVVSRLRSIVGSGEYTKELLNKVLLNLVDIGGQPGFVEMFPFLSKGAGIFLVFFRLDKDLDDMCQVSYERGNDKITPYDSTYTSTEILSQILSAISHHTKIDSDIDREQCSKLGNLGSAKPVATLIGTFKDELTLQIKVDLLYEKYCHSAIYKSDGTTASESDGTTASESDGTTASESDGTTASESDSTSTSKSDSTTASKSDGTTASESDSTTSTSKSDGTTANESNGTTASESDSTSTTKSDGATASESDGTTASESDGTTASKSDCTTASESLKENEQKKAIRNILTQQKSDEHANVSAEDMAAIEQTVSQHLNSDTFKKDFQNRLEKKLTEKNEAMTKITSKFEDLLSHPKDKKFIAVDNYEGTDSDMEPLREHLHGLFSSYFKDAKLRIRPQQLLFGVVLRKEFDIVSMEDCIRIGIEALKMREKEVRFTVWYLDRYVGALIYHPEIKEKDGWFGNFVICNPQVVFNSLSVFVVNPLLELHSEDSRIQFNDAERRNWILKGQFSLKTITRCHSDVNQGVKKDQLIPVEKLLILLEHSHLLAKITTVKEDHTTEEVETTYFIPAILKCASREELTKPPPTGIDTPSPIKITFKPQYVPIGVFCAMISELVSRGSKDEGILGMTWKLATDTSVKRNLVSFHIDESAKHFVTLIAHVDSYEIRIIRQNRKYMMHELCSYVLSTLLLVMKDISPLLTPIIAFDCYCGKHGDATKLCVLTHGVYPCFNCTSEVSLSPHQECWFAKEVSLGKDVSLKALPFATKRTLKDKNLTFEWSKKDPEIDEDEHKLEFKAASLKDHFKGFISCKIFKNQKPFFTVYHCLKESVEDTSSSETDELFAHVKEVIKEIRSDWYSLAIELDIDYATRKSLEKDYRWVEPCFEAMLTHWVKRSSPPPSWSALVRALESPAIARGDIATTIKKTKATSDISPDICPLTDCEGLSVDHHLRVVRTAAWEVRGTWRPLGVQLGVNEGTLDVSALLCVY
ncbi:protein phosphatase 1 regulatory subunit 12A-like [Halichondria panicea]|uniref:protein phosphatase 1 regulatory subunit 12A-like n=1 Tax=Halichondria panicea TaxID=6063 RepID=UPI00312BC8E1